MTRPEQKQWERYYIDLFRRLRPDLVGDPEPADPPDPDFLVHLPDCVLGIELTAFLWDAVGPKGSPKLALDSLRKNVTTLAKSMWQAQGYPPVDVCLFWRRRPELTQEDVRVLAEKLVSLVSSQIPASSDHRIIECPAPGWKSLPRQIAALHVWRPDWLDDSNWSYARGGSVPHLRDCTNRIQTILTEKERKLAVYRRTCDEVWLLIVADASSPEAIVVMEDEYQPHDLISSFDRVFFLSASYPRLVELAFRKDV